MTETVDLVLFEIAGIRYATELSAVRRIGLVEADSSVGYPLGKPSIGKRALVFHPAAASHDVEAQLFIDAILGVHTVPVDDLRRIPLAASISPITVGAWVVDGNQTVLIIDLHATISPSSSSRGIA